MQYGKESFIAINSSLLIDYGQYFYSLYSANVFQTISLTCESLRQISVILS